MPDAAVITVLDDPARQPSSRAGYPVAIDGFRITGGAQSDFPANVNELTGGIKTPYGATGALVTQGGGIYVHNNVQQPADHRQRHPRQQRLATAAASASARPYTGDNRNYDTVIADNQIRDNGGTNLAGGIGLFTGSDGYQVDAQRHLRQLLRGVRRRASRPSATRCNRRPATGGTIAATPIWFNSSYDEGGAIMIAGELPATPTQLSEGTGPVTIDGNVIHANLANDDGGGIRLLQASGSHITKADPRDDHDHATTRSPTTSRPTRVAASPSTTRPFVNIVNNTVART